MAIASIKRNCKVHLFTALFLSMNLYLTLGADETMPTQALPPGEYIFQADALRLSKVHLRLPAGELLDYTGKNDPEEGKWEVRFAATPKDSTIWHLQLQQRSDAVRRQVDYWVFVPAATDNDMGPMEPMFASEAAYDIDNEVCLFRRQSIKWTLRFGEAVNPTVYERVAPWVLKHLDLVYDFEVLEICSDHFFHYPGEGPNGMGYDNSVLCNDRMIALYPQAEDLYTINAWLLWSDWVTWNLDPNRIPGAKDNIPRAVRQIQRGRAANPDSAAYHYDAANTMAPLAQNYKPGLMDFVIRYYKYANALATEEQKELHALIRKALGNRYRILGKKEEAIRWYRATLELDPENEVALRYLKRLTE